MRNNVKKIAAILLAAILVITGLSPVGEAKASGKPGFTVKTSTSAVKPGDTFTAELWLEPESNLSSMVFNYTYDTDTFELVKKVKGPLLAESDMSYVEADPGSISILMDFGGIANQEGGLIYTLTLKVKTDASGTGKVGVDFKSGITGDSDNETTIGGGDVQISGKDENGNDNGGTITVDVELQSIALNKQEAFSMNKGMTDVLSVTAVPANALIGKRIAWTSSDANVVKVDANGGIEAVGAGKATITATVEEKTASVEITVKAPLVSIGLNHEALSMKKGTQEQLSVSYQPSDTTDNKAVTWSSSDASVVKVDQKGKLTALKDGTANITAKVMDHTAVCKVTVKEIPLKGITLDQTKAIVGRDETMTLAVNYNPADTTDNRTVVWSSKDSSIATVENGVVTGKKIGKTVIIAKVGSLEASCEVEVNAPLKAITAEPMALNLRKNQSGVVKVQFDPVDTTDKKDIKWSIDDSTVAEIYADGDTVTVKGKKQGKTMLTAEAVNGIKTICAVNVEEIAITQIEVSPAEKTLEIGDSFTCTVTFKPENTTDNKDVTWTSTNTSVATVENGVVTAIAGGHADIIAKTEKGATAKCTVTVPIHMTGIAISPEEITIRKKETSKLTVNYFPENTTDDKTLIWTSSDTSVAAVNADGEVTGLKEGTAVITAQAKTGGFTSSCTVTVVEIHMTGIAISETMPTELYKGQVHALEVKLLPEDTTDEPAFLFYSSDPSVASISEKGMIQALKEGTTEIKVQTADGQFEASVVINVKEIPLESIAFDKEVRTLEEGKSVLLHVIYNPEDTTDEKTVIWSSSDEHILTVKDGLVKAVKAGKAVVTAKVGEKEASMEITVTEAKSSNGGTDTNGNKNDGTNHKGNQNKKANQNGAVKTGDTNNILSVLVVILLSLSVIVTIAGKRIRRSRVHK